MSIYHLLLNCQSWRRSCHIDSVGLAHPCCFMFLNKSSSLVSDQQPSKPSSHAPCVVLQMTRCRGWTGNFQTCVSPCLMQRVESSQSVFVCGAPFFRGHVHVPTCIRCVFSYLSGVKEMKEIPAVKPQCSPLWKHSQCYICVKAQARQFGWDVTSVPHVTTRLLHLKCFSAACYLT